MHWEVQILGDIADLVMLSESFSGEEIGISQQDKQFILTSSEFNGMESATIVREKAIEIIDAISGLSRLSLSAQTNLSVGSVYNVGDDGGRGVSVFPEPAKLIFRGYPPTVIIGKSDGTQEIHKPADLIANWAPLSLTDSAVYKALRLRNTSSLDWVGLYRIYEVIEEDIGRSSIIKAGWATEGAIKQFKHTANSVEAVGDQARHGKENTSPPKNPLDISQAHEFIDSLLKKWLNSKQ